MLKKLIYSGKAKDIYETDDKDVILVEYKDQATAFNGLKKESIKGKGALNNAISSLIFEKLNLAQIDTHFIKKISDTAQLNKRVKIIPIEVVLRNYAAGSFCNRFGIEEGLKLNKPIIELYYKDDTLNDPFINDEHAELFGLASRETLSQMKEQTLKINVILKEIFNKIGLCLIDYKLEFGIDKEGRLILADEFSPDNCRLWGENKEHMDKDVFRRDLGDLIKVYETVLSRLEKI